MYHSLPTKDPFEQMFGGDLLFFHDTNTGCHFLADSGSIPNLLTIKSAQKHYPEAWKAKRNLDATLQGVGGKTNLEYLMKIQIEKTTIPFATGSGVPINIVGLAWIDTVRSLDSVTMELDTPNSHLTNLIIADNEIKEEKVTHTPSSYKRQVNTANKLRQNTAESQKILSVLSANVGTPLKICGNKTQCATVHTDVAETTNNLKKVPRCRNEYNVTKTYPFWKTIEVTEYQLRPDTPLSIKIELDQLYKQTIQLAQAPVNDVFDPDDTSNILIPEAEWRRVYAPFAKELEDLEGHLSSPQKLPYPCRIELKDPNTPPFVSGPYNLKGEGQKKALNEGINV